MTPNKITFYKIRDIIIFILRDIAFKKKVRNAQFKICDIYNNHLFTLLVDICTVFSSEYIAATIVTPEEKYLVPCLISMNDYEEINRILSEIIYVIPENDLGISIQEKEVMIECIYHDRIITYYNLTKDEIIKKEEKNIGKELLNFFEKLLDEGYEDEEDDDDYNV